MQQFSVHLSIPNKYTGQEDSLLPPLMTDHGISSLIQSAFLTGLQPPARQSALGLISNLRSSFLPISYPPTRLTGWLSNWMAVWLWLSLACVVDCDGKQKAGQEGTNAKSPSYPGSRQTEKARVIIFSRCRIRGEIADEEGTISNLINSESELIRLTAEEAPRSNWIGTK